MAVLENPCACPCVAVVYCIFMNYVVRTIECLYGGLHSKRCARHLPPALAARG